MKTRDLKIYQQAMEIGEDVWTMVQNWEHFSKSALGKQMLRAADSIALNIAEGDGRYFYKERNQFFYFSRGSAYETSCCLQKALQRNLINESQFNDLNNKLVIFFYLINAMIKSIKEKANTK
ncbi:MAG: four helix bundle protein [Sphingobacteriales bacterium]|jgi:four helix bundle protein